MPRTARLAVLGMPFQYFQYTALFTYLVDKKISLLYAGVHLIKGSSESKVLINEGKHRCPCI